MNVTLMTSAPDPAPAPASAMPSAIALLPQQFRRLPAIWRACPIPITSATPGPGCAPAVPGLPPDDTGFAIDLPGEGLIGHVGFHRGTTGHRARLLAGPAVLGPRLHDRGGHGQRSTGSFEPPSAAPLSIRACSTSTRPRSPSRRKLGFTETGRSTLLCLARGEEVRISTPN